MKDDKALWELICKPIEGFSDFPKRPLNNESAAEKAMLYLTGGKVFYYDSFVPSDAKPLQSSFESQGDDKEKHRIYRQLEALCKTLISMGYKKNASGSIEVTVGRGALGAIHKQCYADHGGGLFSQPKTGKNKRDDTFYGIWKKAKSEKYGRLVISIPAK